MTKQRTRQADAAETADDAAPPDPTYPVQLPAMPGISVHYSRISGRHTAVIDQGVTASALTSALAPTYLVMSHWSKQSRTSAPRC
ncbi:hypothetical protein ND748_01995 [Frankia sp. AiPs1]|uniref:hypothetical protein n=1 Tax=Frankia sp. AiPs1 TaxID=573493 RepID=UPI002044909B|nr:hypothetical protein [Frankia sp. AiPs1]MCM3920459.1 hypothetical protein [Frankia sp. AiPs1]